MSKRNLAISPDISEDDESFNDPSCSKLTSFHENTETVTISSDDDTIIYGDYTSDEEDSLPKNTIHGVKSYSDEKEKIVKNLFPNLKSKVDNIGTNYGFNSDKDFPGKCENVATNKTKAPGFVRMIGGVKVNIPVEPYGCQVALMSKVITGITKSENCLLESPTGSGKTLALLCAALAWQKHEQNRIANLTDEEFCSNYPGLSETYTASTSGYSSPHHLSPEKLFAKNTFGDRNIYSSPGTHDNGQRDGPNRSPSTNLVSIHKRRKVFCDSRDSSPTARSPPESQRTPEKTSDSSNAETPESKHVPTIYYGARTHKQIQQVVREFRRTSYCSDGDAVMSLLSSREHSCIREFDRTLYPTKNDMCRECCKPKRIDDRNLDKKSKQSKEDGGSGGDKKLKRDRDETNCEYFDGRDNLHHGKLPSAFDLEDLVKAGHENIACPYYSARDMSKIANIVFCPYNYLIYPAIRDNMKINLKNEIVILDEAHNIEDICRDAATFTITRLEFINAIKELDGLAQYTYANSDLMDDILYILKNFRFWDDWFNNQKPLLDTKPVVNNEQIFTWTIEFFVQTLDNHNIGQKQYRDFTQSAALFCQKLREDPAKLYGVTQATGTLVETVQTIYMYLFSTDPKYMDDFKPALISSTAEAYDNRSGRWRGSERDMVSNTMLSLRLMCMNPAVVFAGLVPARCVLLSSGTLTPLVSLHSELGSVFPHKISPSHVIPPERVWVGTLSTCPDGSPLSCQYTNTNLVHTQDALGQTVLWVCQVTPNGVLCFLPSYFLMNKLVKRWNDTGIWKKMTGIKHVFQESRNAQDHANIMEQFYDYVKIDKGALLFAVYRGKVSEGMDFKDHQARAVITIGIPFPNTQDMMVKEKMTYNDRHSKERNLLSSREWLRVQAYRALNQAVGRCVRHRADWGAVLLVDARFKTNYFTEHLSKWVRLFLGNNHHTFESLVNSNNSLESFMQNMVINQDEGV